MPINKTDKVVILWVKAERIGESDKIKCVISTAALDIENNFLDTEMMVVFVDGEQVTQDASDPQWELAITLQLDYKPEQEALAIHVQHLATGISSPRKYVPIGITWQKQDIPMPEADKVPLDKSTVIAIMQKDGMKLWDSEYIQHNDDYTIVLSAVKQNGASLQFASDRLKNDGSIVDEALCQDADYIHFASEEQQRQYAAELRDVLDRLNNEIDPWERMEKGRTVYQNISWKYKSNKEVFYTALPKYTYYALIYGHPKHKNDREVMKNSIKYFPNIYVYFQHVSIELKNDQEFMLWLIKDHGWSYDVFRHLSDNLKNNKEFMLLTIKQYPGFFRYLPVFLQEDPDIKKAAWK